MANFKRRDLEQYTDSLAAYLPGGVLFAAAHKNGTNFRNFLRGLAGELYRTNGVLREYSAEVLPDETYRFIDEWESALGIPDDCFSGAGDIDERRKDILIKLASLGVQTSNDFSNLAHILGLEITVEPASPYAIFPIVFPVLLLDSEKTARFTILVSYPGASLSAFPLTFPFVFGSSELGRVRCLLTKLKPANCNIIFRQVT